MDRFSDGRGEGVPDCLSSSPPLLEGGEASILCEYTGMCRVKLLLDREIPDEGRSVLWMTNILEFDSSTLFGWV